MAEIFNSHLATVDEVTYGTAVLPTKFWVFRSESLAGVYERIDSEGLRAGSRTMRSDRFVVNPKGASGEVELEVETKQYGFWFKHMLGASSTGVVASGVYPHTFTVGDLRGKSFTTQVNRVDTTGTDRVFTYEGGKVAEWTLSNDVDGLLVLSASCDFEKETIGAGAGAYAAATPSFPTGSRVLSFVKGLVTIGGTTVAVKDISISGSNGLDVERYFIRNNGEKKEPLESDLREFTFDMTLDFDSLDTLNKVASATAAGAVAEVVAEWTSDVAEGGGGFASVEVTLPAARFNDGAINVGGPGLLEQSVSGVALDNGTDSPVELVYTSPDATVV